MARSSDARDDVNKRRRRRRRRRAAKNTTSIVPATGATPPKQLPPAAGAPEHDAPSSLRERIESRTPEVLLAFGSSVFSEIAVAVLFALGGILGARPPVDIWEANRPWFLTSQPVAITPSLAWILFAAAVAVLLLRRLAAGRAERTRDARDADFERQEGQFRTELAASATDLRVAHQKIEKMLRTMPPSTFLKKFAEVHRLNHQAFVSALKAWYTADQQDTPESAEIIREWIRVVLNGIATSVSDFDNSGRAATYGANIMVFRREQRIPPADRAAVEARIIMNGGKRSLRGLEGVLDLRAELSASTGEADSRDADSRIQRIALPVPLVRHSPDGRSYVLPGAPEAFCGRDTRAYDAATIAQHCRGDGYALPYAVIQEVQTYFRASAPHGIGSFVCFPLSWNPADTPKGILNVHSTAPDILQYSERSGDFFHLMRPNLLMLLDLLGVLPDQYKYEEFRADSPDARRVGIPLDEAPSAPVFSASPQAQGDPIQ